MHVFRKKCLSRGLFVVLGTLSYPLLGGGLSLPGGAQGQIPPNCLTLPLPAECRALLPEGILCPAILPAGYRCDEESGLFKNETDQLIDPETGFLVNETGNLIDPATGNVIDPMTQKPVADNGWFVLDPSSGRWIEPLTGLMLDPQTGKWYDSKTNEPAVLDMSKVESMLYAADPEWLDPASLHKLQTQMAPMGWNIDPATGELFPPPGEELDLPWEKLPADLPANVRLPSLPDYHRGCAIAGSTKGGSMLDELNDILNSLGCTSEQSEEGLLHLTCAGAEYALMPGEAVQGPPDATPGFGLDPDTGNPIITTKDKRIFTLYSAPWDMSDLSSAFGENTHLSLDAYGVLTIEQDVQREGTGYNTRSGGYPRGGYKQGTRFDKTDSSPFIPFSKTTGELRYPDGTSQVFFATVPAPDQFITVLKQFPGVEDIHYTLEGWFKVQFQGRLYRLQPEFDTNIQRLPDGEMQEPHIGINPDGSLQYRVQDGGNVLSVRVVILAL